MGQLKNGDSLLAYAIIHGYDETGLKLLAKQRSDRNVEGVFVMRSSDGGKTWSKPVLSAGIHALQKGGATISPYGKIVQLVQGRESRVLDGMREILAKHCPVLVIEVHGDQRRPVEEFLEQAGYAYSVLNADGMPHLLATPR